MKKFQGSDDYSDKSALIPSSSSSGKSYGTDASDTVIAIEDRLTYTWREIDVYGEQKLHIPFWKRMKKKFCSCFTANGREYITRKHLLKNITGVAYSGELLAVMGSSGAGKTTLMNALCFRSPAGVKVSPTSIRALNGVPVNSERLRSQCAYVQQDDLFIASLTAKEHLIFQAMLRMGRDVPHQHKINRVNEVLNELSLRKCANTIIGSPGRIKGLSGGERKRLSFASETLTDPHLLLCDEPTSGLDSFMAHSVLQVLKKLAAKGKTIIVTIHQPSSELYSMFDKILLIAEGRNAFLGTPAQATEFFDQ
jgi:ATP-binding cassette, subfamily G (WHITE), eye pigment precursor transporter